MTLALTAEAGYGRWQQWESKGWKGISGEEGEEVVTMEAEAAGWGR